MSAPMPQSLTPASTPSLEELSERVRSTVVNAMIRHLSAFSCKPGMSIGDVADAVLDDLRSAALSPATGRAGVIKECVFDVEPNLGATSVEPSLRQIVYQYYAPHFGPSEAETLMLRYLAALAAPASPTGGQA